MKLITCLLSLIELRYFSCHNPYTDTIPDKSQFFSYNPKILFRFIFQLTFFVLQHVPCLLMEDNAFVARITPEKRERGNSVNRLHTYIRTYIVCGGLLGQWLERKEDEQLVSHKFRQVLSALNWHGVHWYDLDVFMTHSTWHIYIYIHTYSYSVFAHYGRISKGCFYNTKLAIMSHLSRFRNYHRV